MGLFLSLLVGFGCGVLGVFVDGLNSEGLPFLEWSVGLYVTPPVLLGWMAVRPWLATVAGSITCLSAVVGHLVAVRLAVDDYNVLVYGAWTLVALITGTILGFLGNRIRSPTTSVRAWSAGFPLGLMAVFLLMCVQAQAETGGRAVHMGVFLLEGVLAVFVLTLCRGWAARGAALVCAVALVIPFIFVLIGVFMLVWFASGDY
ncbi:DUF6518 family protein [Nocardiopsis sp. NPDC049922]|uniref:DUF6518 family protein n=1 Tax=Nocardiopsis sp. NPDC049922 TaxID=3155157 RepID=UPI0034091CD0